ncbi:GNAT family N-acetyltransferase [Streptococcus castoreus]|uniref:GNAT family N-acetyltransferase n=1 Tax=Streptococcus castoreus TaxID=254786 RepID=UPI0004828250|nr:GNAT family N-acetyltransferase [Streptococcus castoreus]
MTDTFLFRQVQSISVEAFSNLLNVSGINRPVDDIARLTKMLEHSNYIWTAWDEGHLIGIARALTDFSYVCYLSDLAVDKSYQGQGVGKKLVEMMSQNLGEDVAMVLLSAPSALEYYPKLGFLKTDKAFIIPRKPF